MSQETLRGMILMGTMMAATMITRFLPFVLFPSGKKTPEYITFLGTTLPYATIGLLVVYCLKGLSLFTAPHGLPEILAVLAVAALHWWKGNSLLSIGAGTAVYMLLVQVVFR